MACRLVVAEPLSEPMLQYLLIGPLRTTLSGIPIEMHTFSFKDMHLKMSSAKWHPFCFGLNLLRADTAVYLSFASVKSPSSTVLGWGLLSQFPPFRYSPYFSASPKYMLVIEHHVHIWQVSPQLSCGDICQIWMWLVESNRYFSRIENFAYGEINEQRFSNPTPVQVSITRLILGLRPPYERRRHFVTTSLCGWAQF